MGIIYERTDMSSYFGGIYTDDFNVGDELTWLGHDGVFGYRFGEKFITTQEHIDLKDGGYAYKQIGTYDIRKQNK